MKDSLLNENPNPVALWGVLFRLPQLLVRESGIFFLMSALDLFATYLLLRYSEQGSLQLIVYEFNPIADFFLNRWGVEGSVICAEFLFHRNMFFQFSLGCGVSYRTV